jgi:perosamine synthetase
MQPELPGYKNSYWMVSVVLDEALPARDWVMERLLDAGIETRPFFYPVHVLPMYAADWQDSQFPVADRISKQGLNLPTYAGLTDADIQFICEHLLAIIESGPGK